MAYTFKELKKKIEKENGRTYTDKEFKALIKKMEKEFKKKKLINKNRSL